MTLEGELQRLRSELESYNWLLANKKYSSAYEKSIYEENVRNITNRLAQLQGSSPTTSPAVSPSATPSGGGVTSTTITQGLFGGQTTTNVTVQDGQRTTEVITDPLVNVNPGATPSQTVMVAPVVQYTNPPKGFDPSLYEGTYGKDYIAVRDPETGETVFSSPENIATYQKQSYQEAPKGATGTFTFSGVKTTTRTIEPVSDYEEDIDITTPYSFTNPDIGKIYGEEQARKYYNQYGDYLTNYGLSASIGAVKGTLISTVTGAGEFAENLGISMSDFFSMPTTNMKYSELDFAGGSTISNKPTVTSLIKKVGQKLGLIPSDNLITGTTSTELATSMDALASKTVKDIEINNLLALQQQSNEFTGNDKGFFAYQKSQYEKEALKQYPWSNPEAFKQGFAIGNIIGGVASSQSLFPSLSFTTLIDKPFIVDIQAGAKVTDKPTFTRINLQTDADDLGIVKYGDDIDDYALVKTGTKPIASTWSDVYIKDPITGKINTINFRKGSVDYLGQKALPGGGYEVYTRGITKGSYATSQGILPGVSLETRYYGGYDTFFTGSTKITPQIVNTFEVNVDYLNMGALVKYGTKADDLFDVSYKLVGTETTKNVFDATSTIWGKYSNFDDFVSTGKGTIYQSKNILVYKGLTDGSIPTTSYTGVYSKAKIPEVFEETVFEVSKYPGRSGYLPLPEQLAPGTSRLPTSTISGGGSVLTPNIGSSISSGSLPGNTQTSTITNEMFRSVAETQFSQATGQLVTQNIDKAFASTLTRQATAGATLLGAGSLAGLTSGGTATVVKKTPGRTYIPTEPLITTSGGTATITKLDTGSQNALKGLTATTPALKQIISQGSQVQEAVITEPLVVTKQALALKTLTGLDLKPFSPFNPFKIMPLGGLGFDIIGGAGSRGGRNISGSPKLLTAYTPSFTASILGITGKKPSTKTFTGLETRPIISNKQANNLLGLTPTRMKKVKVKKKKVKNNKFIRKLLGI